MIRGGTDQSDLMAELLELGEVLKRGQMGVPPTDKNQAFTHRRHHPLSSSGIGEAQAEGNRARDRDGYPV
jgi:hypothetical protein